MSKSTVRIGIVTHNRAESLTKSITSTLRQQFPGIEVTVFDDGSTDGTIRLRERFPNVLWFRRNVSGGYMSARNELMAQAEIDYFISLDDDAWFLGNDEVALAIKFFEENPSAAAVAFDILSPDRPTAQERIAPETIATFLGCGHALRSSAVREVGAYQLTPGDYGGEEKDLCLRLMDAGYQIMRLPGVHVWHDKSAIARDASRQYSAGVCNDLILTLRRTPTLLLPLAFIAKFCQHFGFALRKGLVGPCLKGFRVFFRHLPDAKRSRQPVKLATLLNYMRLARTT